MPCCWASEDSAEPTLDSVAPTCPKEEARRTSCLRIGLTTSASLPQLEVGCHRRHGLALALPPVASVASLNDGTGAECARSTPLESWSGARNVALTSGCSNRFGSADSAAQGLIATLLFQSRQRLLKHLLGKSS